MRTTLPATICLAAVIFITARNPAMGQQGSGSSRIEPQQSAKAKTPDEFYKSFWTYLSQRNAPYTKWPALPGTEALREGEGPHGKFVKTYVNQLVAGSPKALPQGAILVAENYGEDQKTLQNIMVMYRVKGSDPQHFDWYWLTYQPDGSIALTSAQEGNKPVAGKVASCIECHAKAKGTDFVFLNDEPAPGGK